MDTLLLLALAVRFLKSIWLRYLAPMWEKCMMSTPVMRVIVQKTHVKLSLLTVVVVRICRLTGFPQLSHQNWDQSELCQCTLLVEASGVGDVGFLTNALLVPQLKTNFISEGELALSGWKTMTFNSVKEIYYQGWNKVMVAVIQNESNPLYIVDPIYIYFPSIESANLTTPEGLAMG